MTPAERNDMLVKAGAERYVQTYRMLMKMLAQGGRTPGITIPSADTLRQHFESTNPGYWQTLAQQDPQEAQSQLGQWKQVQ